MTKKIIRASEVAVYDYGEYTREQIIEQMDAAIEALSADSSNIKFEVKKHEEWGYYDSNPSTSAHMYIKFDRLETDEEYKVRTDNEAKYSQIQKDRDAAEFKRLSKLFGKSK